MEGWREAIVMYQYRLAGMMLRRLLRRVLKYGNFWILGCPPVDKHHHAGRFSSGAESKAWTRESCGGVFPVP